jgi:DNA-binding NarL/FixJ family response regulator
MRWHAIKYIRVGNAMHSPTLSIGHTENMVENRLRFRQARVLRIGTTVMSNPLSPEGIRHTICVVDDYPVIHAGLQCILADLADLVAVDSTTSMDDALNAIRDITPSLVLLDIARGDDVTLELGRELHDHWPGLPWIVFSNKDEILYVERVLRCGGRGYVMKNEGLDQIVEAVRTVLSGEVWLSRRALPHLLRAYTSRSGPQQPIFESLSDRELEIFHLIGKGMSRHDIAERLSITARTVESCEAHLKEGLGMRSRKALLRFARTNRLVLLD